MMGKESLTMLMICLLVVPMTQVVVVGSFSRLTVNVL